MPTDADDHTAGAAWFDALPADTRWGLAHAVELNPRPGDVLRAVVDRRPDEMVPSRAFVQGATRALMAWLGR